MLVRVNLLWIWPWSVLQLLILSLEVSRSSTENSRPKVCGLLFSNNKYWNKLTYFNYALGCMNCNRKAIAAFTDFWLVQKKHYFLSSMNSSVGRTFDWKVSHPGFNPWHLQLISFKKTKISFLNEDTLAIKACSKLKF